MPKVTSTRVNNKPYACLCGCGQRFRSPSELERHERRSIRDHACGIDGCPSRFTQKTTLTEHINKVHYRIATRSCPFCPMMLYTSCDVHAHFQRDHQEYLWHCALSLGPDATCRCSDKGFKDKNTMRSHIRRNHPNTAAQGAIDDLAVPPQLLPPAKSESLRASTSTWRSASISSSPTASSPAASPAESSSSSSSPSSSPAPVSEPMSRTSTPGLTDSSSSRSPSPPSFASSPDAFSNSWDLTAIVDPSLDPILAFDPSAPAPFFDPALSWDDFLGAATSAPVGVGYWANSSEFVFRSEDFTFPSTF